jgi:hypothetical protein
MGELLSQLDCGEPVPHGKARSVREEVDHRLKEVTSSCRAGGASPSPKRTRNRMGPACAEATNPGR